MRGLIALVGAVPFAFLLLGAEAGKIASTSLSVINLEQVPTKRGNRGNTVSLFSPARTQGFC
jgi:hypothetical protein